MKANKEMDTKKVMEIALFTGEILLCSGAEIYRVEDTVRRICESYGVDCECFVMPTGMFLSNTPQSNQHDSITLMRRIKKRSLDLQRIEQINAFSRKVSEEKVSYEEAMDILEEIDRGPNFKFKTRFIAAGITTFVYTLLFGGSYTDGILALFIGMIIYFLQEMISKVGFFQFFEYFLSGTIAAGLSLIASALVPGLNIDKTITGSVVLLVPGIAITSGIKDALYGDLISSMARISEALLVVAAVGAGVGVMLTFGIRWM